MALTQIKEASARLWRDPAVRSALFAFALTRGIVLAVLLLATNLHQAGPGVAFGGPVEDVTISLREKGIVNRLAQAVNVADGLWYTNIARNGYEKERFNLDQQHTWAFFPLYPLIISGAAFVTREFPLTASVLSNIFFFVALIILYRLARAFAGDDSDADRAVFYLAAFPTSYFFSFPFTESLFLLLTVSSFYFARRECWWRAGLLGALASATRLAGIFLLPAFFIFYWRQNRSRRLSLRLLSLGLVPLGLIAYMIYLHSITGNAWAFLDIQAAWGHRPTFFLRSLIDYATDPRLLGARWDFRLLNCAAVLLAFFCGGVLLKRREWALATYTLLSVIVPLSATLNLQSMTRYVMVIFPIFFVLASAGRSRRGDQIIRAVFITLLGLLTALFALHVTLALA
jgi:Mannosyltransferase (PIG-V)